MFKPKNIVDWLEWFGMLTGIGGAAIISSNIGYVGQGYIIFGFSAACYLVFAWKFRRWPLFIMNSVFMVINFWGVWRWLIEPMIENNGIS